MEQSDISDYRLVPLLVEYFLQAFKLLRPANQLLLK